MFFNWIEMIVFVAGALRNAMEPHSHHWTNPL